MTGGFGAIVLAGGRARRMGGVDKPLLPVGERSMLDRVLDACREAAPRVLVGAVRGTPPDVRVTREEPPGGGPVAALAAGLARLDDDTATVAVLAADLPFLDPDALATLRTALRSGAYDGVVFVDESGRRQLLCGAWRVESLRAALSRLGDSAGASMRGLLAGLSVAEEGWSRPGPPPWFDCDTQEDLERAEEWARRR
ncbi:molybdenum cofactor guanylyltransferase [Phytohabitans aurantiacus]|uniref:Molybdenum cofactor guanylyltransferase n=1 Tax=Phytohabitans aurantiacus TaxID=3016789 RepID=A0ABQ5QMR8_9ACTN|nr:molybdenum cofactor guanylyltransferase [Phytohabitans aurantiacus]GLH95176.1 molybdenum cofactor guanylyltransferase [Phytohabitans aurantiacus]